MYQLLRREVSVYFFVNTHLVFGRVFFLVYCEVIRMSITLIRHGQTDWNIEKRMQGQLDINLNVEGVQQIHTLANQLKADQPLTRIFTSPLCRAKYSAQILGEILNVQVEVVDELKELNFGVWQGMTYEEIQRKHPEEWTTWHQRGGLTLIPMAEQISSGIERVTASIDSLAEKYKDPIGIVTHGTIIEIYLNYLQGISPEAMKMERNLIPNGTYVQLDNRSLKDGGK